MFMNVQLGLFMQLVDSHVIFQCSEFDTFLLGHVFNFTNDFLNHLFQKYIFPLVIFKTWSL